MIISTCFAFFFISRDYIDDKESDTKQSSLIDTNRGPTPKAQRQTEIETNITSKTKTYRHKHIMQ